MKRRPPRSTLDRSSAASDVYKRQVTLSADASDNSGTVTRVDFIIDGGTSIQSDTTAPFSFSMPVTTAQNGNHTVQARAYDLSLIHISEPTRPY